MDTIEKQSQTLVGTWSPFTCEISGQAKEAFQEAELPLGQTFSPVAVSQQVVAGMNYRYFCNTKVVYPNSLNSAAIVCIYKPLEGKAVVTSITPIHL